jgi:hypothetical protein
MNFNRREIINSLKEGRLVQLVKKYIYLETLFLVGLFLGVGYFTSPDDICFIENNIPYLLILLSIVTLFHGFESGMLALSVIAISMWLFYDSFPYNSFLIDLLMVMIFSQFQYFWTKQIKELKTNNDYVSVKLNELANSFYSLKISHDQLEKSHVLKPMSIRSAIEEILYTEETHEIAQEKYFNDFLALLEKSFHMQGGFILYQKKGNDSEYLKAENSLICYSSTSEIYKMEDIFKEYLVDKSINYKQVVYVSDDEGNPALRKEIEESQFLVSVPIVYNNKILAVLVIEKMPFIAFNRENLISISILFEYLLISGLKEKLLQERKELNFLKDKEFRYEYLRIYMLSKKYKIDSTLMIFKIDNEIQSIKLHKQAQKMLRALDLLSSFKLKNHYYMVFLFPLSDQSAALGYLKRLLNSVEDERDKKFEHMLFDVSQDKLILKYIEDKYHD